MCSTVSYHPALSRCLLGCWRAPLLCCWRPWLWPQTRWMGGWWSPCARSAWPEGPPLSPSSTPGCQDAWMQQCSQNSCRSSTLAAQAMEKPRKQKKKNKYRRITSHVTANMKGHLYPKPVGLFKLKHNCHFVEFNVLRHSLKKQLSKQLIDFITRQKPKWRLMLIVDLLISLIS